MAFWKTPEKVDPNQGHGSNVPAKVGNDQSTSVKAGPGKTGQIVPDRKAMGQATEGWPVPPGFTPETKHPNRLLDTCRSEGANLVKYGVLTRDATEEVIATKLASLDPVKKGMYAVLYNLRLHGSGATEINFLLLPGDRWATILDLLFEEHVQVCLPAGKDGVVIKLPELHVSFFGRKVAKKGKRSKEGASKSAPPAIEPPKA